MVDTLRAEAAITGPLNLTPWKDRLLRSLSLWVRAQSRVHHITDRLEERGVEKEVRDNPTEEKEPLSKQINIRMFERQCNTGKAVERQDRARVVVPECADIVCI